MASSSKTRPSSLSIAMIPEVGGQAFGVGIAMA